MFGSKKNESRNPGRIDSLVGVGSVVEGNIRFSGGLRIDGEVRGVVSAAGGATATLVISEMARVEGEVTVDSLVLNGTVIGPVKVASLEMLPRARIVGDVEYASIEMHQGAIVEGRFKHRNADGGEPGQGLVD